MVDATVNVMVDEPEPGAAMDVLLKAAVVPEGSPVTLSAMAELKLPAIVVVIVLVPFAPWATETAAGEAEIAKPAGAGTVRVTVEVCVIPPPAEVTVIGYDPGATAEATARVIVEVPEPGTATEAGLKVTVTPAGWPLADREITELKPPETAVVMVDVPLAPGATDNEEGEAEAVNAGGVVTLRITLDVRVSPPPVPVTTIVCVPTATPEATARVMVNVPEPGAAMEVGLKLTVTPEGCPLAESAMAELKPPETAVVTVHEPLLPATTETEVGEADIVNAAAVTVRVIGVV